MFKNNSTTHVNGDTDKEKENAKVSACGSTRDCICQRLILDDRAQVAEISKRLEDMDIHDVSEEYLYFALRSKYAAGNTERAIEILLLHQRSISGIILPYNPNVNMLGAENRGNVTCYLDALLFAMFAKLEAFECMLKHDLTNEPQRNLAALIRLWVNMLRSGKLIHTDMV